MALIDCPECGNEISDKAETCPDCGYPLKKPKINKLKKEEAKTISTQDDLSQKTEDALQNTSDNSQTWTIIRLFWFLSVGWMLGIGWVAMALAFIVTIIGSPVGIAMLYMTKNIMLLKFD